MTGFGRYSFRHLRTGKIAVIMAGSQAEALKALTCYPHAYEFIGYAPA